MGRGDFEKDVGDVGMTATALGFEDREGPLRGVPSPSRLATLTKTNGALVQSARYSDCHTSAVRHGPTRVFVPA